MLIKSLVGTLVMSLAIGATSLIAAQAPAAENAKGSVTIAGCLQGPIPLDEYALSLPNDPVSTAGATLRYRLTNVTTKASSTAPSIYVVVGGEKQLTPHLGHQVEIVGTILKDEPVAPKTSAQPAVRVQSVRMVSAKCGATR